MNFNRNFSEENEHIQKIVKRKNPGHSTGVSISDSFNLNRHCQLYGITHSCLPPWSALDFTRLNARGADFHLLNSLGSLRAY